jgi:putative Mg2+ transporter-C (MgtC) family protein
VASGIGFIGGGAILREGASVRGLTTAASLWASAAIGLAAGAGMIVVAAASVGVVLAMLVGLRVARERFGESVAGGMRVVTLDYESGHGTLAPVLDRLRGAGAQVQDLVIDDGIDGARLRHVEVTVRALRPAALDGAVAELSTLSEVHDASVQATPS